MPIEDRDEREAISTLLNEFGWRADNGLGIRMAELFTEDATVTTPHFSLSGREQIHDWFSTRATATRVSRHFWSNLRLERTAPGRYTATAYALTMAGAPPAGQAARVVFGTSTDEVVFEGSEAKFASRTLMVAFEGELKAAEAR